MNELMEAVFSAWEEWDLETDRELKAMLRIRFFREIERAVIELKLKNKGGLPMTLDEFRQSASRHYATWMKRTH